MSERTDEVALPCLTFKRDQALPRCYSKQVSRIVYGLITPAGAERYRGKNVVFGGCGVPPAEPRWECRKCGLRLGGTVGPQTAPRRTARDDLA